MSKQIRPESVPNELDFAVDSLIRSSVMDMMEKNGQTKQLKKKIGNLVKNAVNKNV